MSKQKTYRMLDLCKELGISVHTLSKWYQWEKLSLKDGLVKEPYLPVPEKLMNERGKPKIWTQQQLDQLRDYKSHIVMGRNGNYGRYSNPLNKNYKHKEEN